MIDVRQLTKWYGPTLAVDRISFSIPQGRIVGFLGPNGAGKSTTLRMLTGFLPPSSGEATIDGRHVLRDSLEVRKRIGYLPENTPVYPEMRVEEFLHFRGRLYDMPRAKRNQRIGEVCDRCGLGALRRRLIGRLSKGNRQRVGLAQALLHEPPILILDEPTAGLDPNQIGAVRELISQLRDRHTILLSTHILSEVEKTADEVLIIAQGRIVAQGAPAELHRSVSGGGAVIVEVQADPQAVRHALRAVAGVEDIQAQTYDGWCRAHLTPADTRDLRQEVGALMHKNQWAVRELRLESGNLEQFFAQITAGTPTQLTANHETHADDRQT